MALTEEDTLALKLTKLVVPNWPTIKRTDISVLDARDCARRATPEQRQTAREAREVMESIWMLKDEAPVRKLLEALCQYTESSSGDGEQVPLAEMPPRREGTTIPIELVLKVLRFLILDSEDSPRDADLVSFGHLRLVNKSLKALVEAKFPHTLQRCVTRIVRYLLHFAVQWQGKPVQLAKAILPSAPLFSLVKVLYLFFAGDEVDALNNILPLFDSLETLVIGATTGKIVVTGLDLRGCTRLQVLRVEVVDEGGLDMPNPRGWGRDVHVNRHHQQELGRLTWGYRPHAPASLVRVEVRTPSTDVDATNLFDSLGWIAWDKELHVDCQLDDRIITALGLERYWGPASLVVNEPGTAGELVARLARGGSTSFKELTVIRSALTDPSILSLPTNAHLTVLDLYGTKLQSAAFGLDLNTHLTTLHLAACFPSEDASTVVALCRQMGAQLAANTTLADLRLDGNGITDLAARHLRLRDNTGLRKLWLAMNKISDAGLRAALDGNATLGVVDASETDVTEGCAQELSTKYRNVFAR